jgi:nucleotidyltransferase substrate binding protein (TIGR01987 family)
MSSDALDLSAFASAVSRLEEAMARSPANDLERDGCIQRFEYTYELAWKMMRRHMIVIGAGDAELLGRRELFREAARRGLIDDPERWFGFQKARNITSHNYDEHKAEVAYREAKDFLPHAKSLLEKLIDLHA